MTDLAALIAKLEAATEGSVDLDAQIFVATAESPFEYYPGECVLAVLGGFRARVELDEIPKFTRSIDSALTLVPNGHGWAIFDRYAAKRFHASVNLFVKDPPPSPAPMAVGGYTDASAPLALVIASLKARAALNPAQSS